MSDSRAAAFSEIPSDLARDLRAVALSAVIFVEMFVLRCVWPLTVVAGEAS